MEISPSNCSSNPAGRDGIVEVIGGLSERIMAYKSKQLHSKG